MKKWTSAISWKRISFLVFFLYLLLMYSKVFIYYDDFGYLSLTYGYTVPGVAGHHFQLNQIMEFLKEHYSVANGRLLYMFLYLFSYWMGGIRGLQTVMALIVFTIMWLLCRLVEKTHPEIASQPLFYPAFLLLYGSIGLLVQRQAAYWYAASFVYFTPAIPFLLFLWEDCKTDEPVSMKRACLLSVLAFLAGFSQEQWIVALLVSIILVRLWKWLILKQSFRLRQLFPLVTAIAGASVILTSPAVTQRFQSSTNAAFMELNLLQRFANNLKAILNLFATHNNVPYLMVFCAFIFFMSLLFAERRMMQITKQWKRGAVIASCLFFLSGLFMTTGAIGLIFDEFGITSTLSSKIHYLYWILYFAACALLVTEYFLSSKNMFGFFLFAAGVCSLGCMLIVPELPPRIVIQFELLSFYLMGCLLADLMRRREWMLSVTAAGLIFALCGSNLADIYLGYAENYQVLLSNETIIETAVEEYEENQQDTEIILQVQPKQLYGNDMMYQESVSFMEAWIRNYYQIPDEISIVYYADPVQ